MNLLRSANQSVKPTFSTSLLYVIGFIIFLLSSRMVQAQQAFLQAQPSRPQINSVEANARFVPFVTNSTH